MISIAFLIKTIIMAKQIFKLKSKQKLNQQDIN